MENTDKEIAKPHNQNVEKPLPLVINNQFIIDTHYASTGRILDVKYNLINQRNERKSIENSI